jgi:UV DNA damage endonuclease
VLVRVGQEVQEVPRRLSGANSFHRLGFAVKVLGEDGLPSHDTRRWQSSPHLSVSLERLRAILEYCDRSDIRMYRMATALAPYSSHPDMPQFHGQVAECEAELAEVGALAGRLGVRLSTHPGQYTVLNSTDDAVRDAAVAELEVQGALLEAMGLGPEAVVVLHIGGMAGGRDEAIERFRRGHELLSERASARIVVENDDRSFALADALRVSELTGARVVWDVHHHHCNDPDAIGDREALELAVATWPDGVTPKVHFSSPRLDIGERRRRVGRRVERSPVIPQLRRHADLIDPFAFESYLTTVLAGRDVDVVLEAKGKDLALLRLREQLADRRFEWVDGGLSVAAP